jgi:adenylate kinase family enzyme
MRVAVIGIGGSGKTTFAKRLAEQLGVPHIELDSLYWLPDWQVRDREGFRAAVAQAVTPERWVTDGNYSAVRDLVWTRATHVVWLNYPLTTVLLRLVRRTLRRSLRRETLFSGNRETLRRSFLSFDSILWYVLTHYHRTRRRYRKVFDERPFPGATFHEIRSPREAERFLADKLPTLCTLPMS